LSWYFSGLSLDLCGNVKGLAGISQDCRWIYVGMSKACPDQDRFYMGFRWIYVGMSKACPDQDRFYMGYCVAAKA
jgi:hypothetical protein